MPLKKISELSWTSNFVQSLPGDAEKRNYTRAVQNITYSEVAPTPVRNPRLIAWSKDLAEEIGILQPQAEGDDHDSLEILSGNSILPTMRPYSARYGGHQFGQWAGQLGDGRAITLGEVKSNRHPQSYELQLKGAGMTPYSRHADGRAVLRSSLREFICSEAMHYLGIPTTRALSLVTTGEAVMRDMFYDGNPRPEPGAIVCRVSPSFLRFGNFEILTANGEVELLKKLADFLIQTQYVHFDLKDPDVYAKLLDEICSRTALMIAHWMRVGFVHGVMNTDNMSVLGLTIDYGPYGWLEPFDLSWTPNTTDAQTRRYCFGNQPKIAFWNLVRCAEALFPLIQNEKRIQTSLEIYQKEFDLQYSAMLAQKLGLSSIKTPDDRSLVSEMFGNLEKTETDFTLFFRALSESKPMLSGITQAFYQNPSEAIKAQWDTWFTKYQARLDQDGLPLHERQERMKQVNPKYVPRNYLAQNAIVAAEKGIEKGDLSVLDRLFETLKRPYQDQPVKEDLAEKRPDWAKNTPGCSALSCSS